MSVGSVIGIAGGHEKQVQGMACTWPLEAAGCADAVDGFAAGSFSGPPLALGSNSSLLLRPHADTAGASAGT